jgi:hypothetical protein
MSVVSLLAASPGGRSTDLSSSQAYRALPLSFVPNRGQTDARVRYYAQAPGIGAYFTRDGVTLSLAKGERVQSLKLRFAGANATPAIEPGSRRPGRVNYFIGSERHASIPTYGGVTYRDLWPGIDLVFTGERGRLKYEFRVTPGTDPTAIRLAYSGVKGLSLTGSGELAVHTPIGTLTDAAPRTLQPGGATVPSRFVLHGRRSYGFALGRYDHAQPLVIDPGLAYSTFLGGDGYESGEAVAVDSEGNAYVAGPTGSTNFPATAGSNDTTYNGDYDVFVTKFNPDGSGLIYSTFVGGAQSDHPRGMALDAHGNVYVTGYTQSSDLPTTPGAFDAHFDGQGDNFVMKLNSTGSGLLYSTYLGGTSDEGQDGGVAVDDEGDAYVTGFTFSSDFPTTAGAYDTSFNGVATDSYVTKLNPMGSGLVYSTYLGGSGRAEIGTDVAIDADGHAYVTGQTESLDFPTTPGAYDSTFGDTSGRIFLSPDAYLTELNQAGSGLVFSTYLGGTGGEIDESIALDADGYPYVSGATSPAAPEAFPTTPGAYDRTPNGSDGFVTKFARDGSSLVYSTYLGGSGGERGGDLALDRDGDAYVTGSSVSTDFPTTPDAFDRTFNSGSSSDAFVTKVDPAGSSLVYSSYLGGFQSDDPSGIAVDRRRNAYVVGSTFSFDFPVTANAYDRSHNPYSQDAYLTKFAIGFPPPTSLALSPKVATNSLDESSHCVTADVRDASGDPSPEVIVRFSVSGTVSASGSETTGQNGEAGFCYQGPELPGTDQISASVDPSGPSDTATKTWVVPQSSEGCKVTGGGRIRARNDDLATFSQNAHTIGSGEARGRVLYTDEGPADPFRLQSKAIGALVCDGRLATIFGGATLGASSVNYRIDLEDRGRPGRRDTYRILLSTCYDSGTQTLSAGDLQVRG